MSALHPCYPHPVPPSRAEDIDLLDLLEQAANGPPMMSAAWPGVRIQTWYPSKRVYPCVPFASWPCPPKAKSRNPHGCKNRLVCRFD